MYCAGADPNYEPFLANPVARRGMLSSPDDTSACSGRQIRPA
jgi:hypothetical protein